MATAEPQKWSATLGANADVNTLPATTPAGSGRASTSGLFPPITQQPLDEGGLAPERADFNALFKYLGEYIYYAMQGGVYTYVTTYNYTAGNFVLHEGSLYLCIASNGPGSAIKYPTNTAYWRQLALTSQLPIVNNGTLTIQRNGSNVATFSANQAGNTTANISVPTVNNGTLTIQRNGSNVATFSANQAGNTTANISVPTVNNGTLTIQQNGVTVGSFTANQSGNTTVNITGGGSGPQIFFASVDSTQDATIRAAGFWRCGRGYAFWHSYGSGSAGGRWYICYAPNGHTITEVDLRWSYAQLVVCGINGSEYTPGSKANCAAWDIPPDPDGAAVQHSGVDIPTVGMTSASEVAFPTNPYA